MNARKHAAWRTVVCPTKTVLRPHIPSRTLSRSWICRWVAMCFGPWRSGWNGHPPRVSRSPPCRRGRHGTCRWARCLAGAFRKLRTNGDPERRRWISHRVDRMEKVSVRQGKFVFSGEPSLRWARKRVASATALALETDRPTLYIEFRKTAHRSIRNRVGPKRKLEGHENDS